MLSYIFIFLPGGASFPFLPDDGPFFTYGGKAGETAR